ncbi:MAG: NYN domain-containing protein [Gammaproteobacteria bacterium]
MSDSTPTRNMAVYCDFENLALGVRDARLPKFDIHKVLERLLLKGNIVVRKAYCDWARYQDAKAPMHEAAFELIEIPHVRQSGKNSADIHMVVDALDLCYTKPHVDSFVLLTGDSDFSPLVSKLRENGKIVIGVGVKTATSNLLRDNCDEFVYYDDLVRSEQKKKDGGSRKGSGKRGKRPAPKDARGNDGARTEAAAEPAVDQVAEDTIEDLDTLQAEGIEMVLAMVEDLFEERSEDKLWGSMVKQTLKRRHPGFSERYHGFKTFGALLETARDHGYLVIEFDEKSGGHLILGFGPEA